MESVITENMMYQVDSYGYSTIIMMPIINHINDEVKAISKSNLYVVTKRGKWRLSNTTEVCKLFF